MEKKPLLLVLAILLLVIQPASASMEITVRDDMAISIPSNDFMYIDVVIPDDLGTQFTGEAEYVVESSAPPEWDDLTTQMVRTNAFNTVIIPIQFRTFGKKDGMCSGRFEIRLSSLQLNSSRSWSGEVCVSNYTDVNTASGKTGMAAVNDNVNLFDAGFSPPKKIVRPGSVADFVLDIESYAVLDFDITTVSGLTVSLQDTQANTGPVKPKVSINVNVTAPSDPGDYDFTVNVKAGCGQGFCTRQVKGSLTVLSAGSDAADTSYVLSVFPTGISVKDLKPVQFELTVYNPGKAKTLSLSMDLPENVTSDFSPTQVTLNSGEQKKISFTVTPQEAIGFGVIKLSAVYEGKTKFVTAQLSTNEMLSDTMRQADSILSQADSSTARDVNSAMSEWMNKYSDAPYGEELSDYNTIKDRLNAAAAIVQPEDNDTLIIPSEPEARGFNPLIILVVIGIAGAAIAGFIFYKRRSSDDIGNMEI
jgi:hypothetical protein